MYRKLSGNVKMKQGLEVTKLKITGVYTTDIAPKIYDKHKKGVWEKLKKVIWMEITNDEIKGIIHNLEKREEMAIYVTIEFLKSKIEKVKAEVKEWRKKYEII